MGQPLLPHYNFGDISNRITVQDALVIPNQDINSYATPVVGLVTINPSNSTFYYYNGTAWQTGGGGGGGSVSLVNTGTGLIGGPITTTGTISLANTAVTPGSYTSANITVDQQGRITAAANGSGGGGGVTSISGNNGIVTSPTTITSTGTIGLAPIAANSVLANTTGSSGVPSSALGYSSVFTTSNLVSRDSNGVANTNNFTSRAEVQTLSGAIYLTAANARRQVVAANNTVDFFLPDATTLQKGHTFEFLYQGNAFGYIEVEDSTGTTLIPELDQGGCAIANLRDNSTAAGVWDINFLIPNNVDWNVTGLDLPGSFYNTGSVRLGYYTTNGFLKTSSSNGTLIIDTNTYLTTISGISAGGDLTGTYTSPTIGANKVTYAKFQQVAASSLVGNPTGSPANASEITLGSGLSFSGTTLTATGSGGTVTAVSVASSNGFAGTSSGGTTPALTLTTSINSPILAGNGTALIAATTTGTSSTAVLATNPTLAGVTITDANNIVIGSTTGTKIGTATTQKLAFYNSTPIVQPTGDVATALTNLGLVATPTIIATTNANLTGDITSVGNAVANVTTLPHLTTASALVTTGTMTSGTIGAGYVIAGVTMTLGSDANYDTYYRNSSGVLTRLANGTTGQVYTATTGAAPSWSSAGAGTVTTISSIDGNATFTSPTTTPVITIVSAPKLQTARNINNVSFNGTADILLDVSINAQTGTTYAFLASDDQKLVTFNNASAITATVSTNATTPIPIGAQIDLMQIGAGTLTIAAAGGVTINSFNSGLSPIAANVGLSLIKTATNTWSLVGATSGVGTVNSVSTDATLTGGPITTSGTLGINLANANTWTGVTTFTPAARTSGSASYFTINAPADTGLATTVESIGVNYVGATRTWVDGTTATQREYLFQAPTYNKTTTSATFTKAATLAISGAPTAGTGVTITNAYALWVQAGLLQADGGIATTTVNKVTLTAPATGSTLTIADGKTATISNTLTFTGTDASSVNFGAGGTMERIIAVGYAALAAGSTAQQNVVAVKIPANQMNANGLVKVEVLWTKTGSGGTWGTIVNNSTTSGDVSNTPAGGGAQYYAVTSQANTTLLAGVCYTYIYAKNSTSSQFGKTASQGAFAFSNSFVTSTIATTSDWYVNINITPASGTDSFFVGYTVTLINP